MTDLLNNITIESIMTFVITFSSTITALIIFLRNIIKTVKEIKCNSEDFKTARSELSKSKAENDSLRREIKEIRESVEVIRKRQEIAYCNTRELVENGQAKAIMSITDVEP